MSKATKRPAERIQPERAAKMRKHIQVTKLTDLNFDCLTNIFKFLNPTELTNLFLYNQQFFEAVQYVLRTKYKNWTPVITNDPKFGIDGKSQTVKLIKAFDNIMGSLKIDYSHSSHRYDWMIERAIMRYCRSSKKTVCFEGAGKDIMSNISEPFNAVERVVFTKSELGHLVMNFGKWFPNGDYLGLTKTTRQAEPNIFKNHHPNLKKLCVIETRMNTNDLINFIVANPQLEALTFTCDEGDYDGIKLTEELILSIKTELKNLKDLHILIPNGMDWPFNVWSEKIHFEHLVSLSISNGLDTNIWEHFPITFGRVENLTLNGNVLNCAMFIEQNRNISSLAINGIINTVEHIFVTTNLLTELPNLEYLQIRNDREITRYVMDLLIRCEKLKVVVYVYSVPERDPRCHPHHKPRLYNIGGKIWCVKGYTNAAQKFNRTSVYRRYMPMPEA